MPINKTRITRRDFLKIMAGVGGTGMLLGLGLNRSGAIPSVTDSRSLMGTVVNLTLVGGDVVTSRKAMTAMFDRMKELETVFSRFIPHSELSKLNRTGSLLSPHPEFVNLITQAQEIGTLTGGAFDITVKPLVDLYQDRMSQGKSLPNDNDIQRLLPLVDYTQLRATQDKVWFEAQGMGVTLDGIAKGYIVDQGVDVLKKWGYTNVLVEAGGDLVAAGERSTHAPWRIGIQSPRAVMDNLIKKIDLSDKAIATSGDYMQPYSEDMQSYHIVDPRTGYSSPYMASASVIAPTCQQADALATALMVMDAETGMALIKKSLQLDALLITKDLRILSTLEL